MATTESEKIHGHVFYFEPNDLSMGTDENNNTVPLMGHMEDLCIAMNLTAEIYPRDIPSIRGGSDNNTIDKTTRTLSWISYITNGKGEPGNAQIINAGMEMGQEKYLTTYYTEISADQYIKDELVEGLGVTRVTVAFESWYVPTITIEFVDVRGSALWGREEALHESGALTANNILGVFFTQPYPRFHLQIKGFLGQSVTFELSVSRFRGRYNSQTGNFEATVNFIGYMYSLLTDVPLKFLSYISEFEYVGKQYWNDHVNTSAWALPNEDGTTSKPVKLYQLINIIKTAIGDPDTALAEGCDGTPNGTEVLTNNGDASTTDNTASQTDENDIQVINGEVGSINHLWETLQNFIDIHGRVNGEDNLSISGRDEERTYQILIISAATEKDGKKRIILNKDYKEAYKKLCESLEAYNDKKSEEKQIKNGIKESHKTLDPALNSSGNGGVSIPSEAILYYDGKGKLYPVSDYEKIAVNGFKINREIANELKGEVEKRNNTYAYNPLPSLTDYTGKNYVYATLIRFGSLYHDIVDAFNEAQQNAVSVESRAESPTTAKTRVIEEMSRKQIRDMVGFEPTIGNFVKVVMCHLETLVEVMMTCADEIYKNLSKRTLSTFGLALDYTDIANYNQKAKSTDGIEDNGIWPWPALYNNRSHESLNTNAKYEALGYPDDYAPLGASDVDWEEMRVVNSIMNAIRRYGGDIEETEVHPNTVYEVLPISAMDLSQTRDNLETSPFKGVKDNCTRIGQLASYLGLRIANLIGVSDNKCNDEDAYAIGYMDALNLVSSCNQYSDLEDAIGKGDQTINFSEYVINYITCNNQQADCADDTGNSFNYFEKLKRGGSIYHDTRHPIFAENKNGSTDKLVYSYTYIASNITSGISVIPTTLREFTVDKNQYNDILTATEIVGTDKYSFTPQIVDSTYANASQGFVYTCESSRILPSENPPSYYINDQLFNVLVNPSTVQSFVERIESFKNGNVKYDDYAVKGIEEDENAKKFFDRRYKTGDSDYEKFFKGKESVLLWASPQESYANSSLCLSEDQKNNRTYNNHWWDTNTTDYSTIKGNVTDDETQRYIGELPIHINGKRSNSRSAVFGSEFFFLQGQISEYKRSLQAKAYVILSSMMTGIAIPSDNLFKTESCSVIQKFPPCYIYFLGALLWRRKYIDDNNTEPLNFGNFATIDKDDTLLTASSDVLDGTILYVYTNNNEGSAYYPIYHFFANYEIIDIAVRNKLIRLFETFVDNSDFKSILTYCELIPQAELVDSWETLRSNWTDSNFDKTSPNHWSNVFSNIFGNYSSITLSSGQNSLRLLFNENNPAMDVLKSLYGYNSNGFIVGRTTTGNVGQGNDEVTVTNTQMKNYLEGFYKRITDVIAAVSNNTKPNIGEGESERDLKISIYYSLKHLWDSWLITAPRYKFTVENFFNKYFIFMDSFYMNTYNSIKLNLEHVLDAYRRQDANLLNFIESVSSKAGCMFLSLPTFIDPNDIGTNSTVESYRLSLSNNDNIRIRNLQSIFTPTPYNDMGLPEDHNLFVFIYTHRFSDSVTEANKKRYDSYTMYDVESRPEILNEKRLEEKYEDIVNNATPAPSNGIETEELVTGRKGYLLPCFGVTVNRANNYIFKSINVTMDSPKITAISAQTIEDLYSKAGADGAKRIFFHGQDIYSIYSQYSYQCEIEMLGCAQILPLMYFQLLNIPMWRGAYMIYSVTHTMTPGDMTTKFTGMKMSRRQNPYANTYHSIGVRSRQSISDNNSGQIILSGASQSGRWYVGGEDMIKKIFGDADYRINYNYDEYRSAKGNVKAHYHTGIDIGGNEGTELNAPWDGYVVRVSDVSTNPNPGGNYIIFADESKTFAVVYMHCEKILVTEKTQVSAGQPIATLGKTGGNYKPHLHLELHVNGNFSLGARKGPGMPNRGGNAEHVDPSIEWGRIG